MVNRFFPSFNYDFTRSKVYQAMMNMITYCDGVHNLLEIANLIDEPIWDLTSILKPLIENGLITIKH